MNIKIYTGKLLGRDFQTDDAKLFNLLASAQEWLGRDYPGFHIAVTQSLMLLDKHRLRASLITYFNHRVQAWALGFDADPTPPIRVIPTGMSMDPSGPVSFAVTKPAASTGWALLSVMKEKIVYEDSNLDVSAWLKLVPAELLDAMTHLSLTVADKYLGEKATPRTIESLVHEIYGAMVTYLQANNLDTAPIIEVTVLGS